MKTWKQRFRKQFYTPDKPIVKNNSVTYMIPIPKQEDLELFISSLIKEERADLIKRVEKKSEQRKSKSSQKWHRDWDLGYDTKTEEVLDILKEV